MVYVHSTNDIWQIPQCSRKGFISLVHHSLSYESVLESKAL